LFLCTGNICRSPLAEVLLRARLEADGIKARVHSAGVLEPGLPAHSHGISVAAQRGLDLTAHRSRLMTAPMLMEADLVLGMAREHVREAAVLAMEAWPRIFTLKEFVRRGESLGIRAVGDSLESWLALVHAGRTAAELSGTAPEDDVADPIGSPRPAYERLAGELTDLVDRAADLIWPKVRS